MLLKHEVIFNFDVFNYLRFIIQKNWDIGKNMLSSFKGAWPKQSVLGVREHYGDIKVNFMLYQSVCLSFEIMKSFIAKLIGLNENVKMNAVTLRKIV